MDSSSVKQSDSPSTLDTCWEELDQTNADNITNYYDTPKLVVDVLGRAVSKTYRRLPESRNFRHSNSRYYRNAVPSARTCGIHYCNSSLFCSIPFCDGLEGS